MRMDTPSPETTKPAQYIDVEAMVLCSVNINGKNAALIAKQAKIDSHLAPWASASLPT